MGKTNFGETIFDNFIESIGGELVKKRFGKKSPPFKNADYKFDKPTVIIELKTLESEYTLNSPERVKKMQELFQKWVDNGKLTKQNLEQKKLPDAFVIELLKLFKPPFKNLLVEVNKQIKGTKEYFKKPNAQGLVVFLNDGFYGLDPTNTIAVIGDLLQSHFSAIDGFVYLTLRKRLEIPNDEDKRILWIPKYRKSDNKELSNFVNWLGQNWFDYLETESGKEFNSKIESYDPENKYLIGSKFEN